MSNRRPRPRFRDVRHLFTIPEGSLSRTVSPEREPEPNDELRDADGRPIEIWVEI